MKSSYREAATLASSRRSDPTGHVRLSVAERREYRRNPVKADAMLTINNEVYSAELLDISTGGAQLRCAVVPRNGMDVCFGLKGFGEVPARVVRRLPKSVALEFDLTHLQRAEFAEKLDRLIKAHA
ncbi:MAG: hypothetical protein Dbin4_01726 [Alphaproteobacteria bacterium]|nr:hypothetical protein [Alphaproteobacteria bacterium]